jgi:hypothetical protein
MKLRGIVLALAIGLACSTPSSALPNTTGSVAHDSTARDVSPKRTHFPWGAIVVPELLVFLLIVAAVRRSKRG